MLKSSTEVVRVLPSSEIANVPGVADKRRPTCRYVVYGIVDLDREQHGFARITLLC